LHRPVLDGWDSKRSHLAVFLRDEDTAERFRLVPSRLQRADGIVAFRVREPSDLVHSCGATALVRCNLPNRQCLGGKRVNQDALEGFHPANAVCLLEPLLFGLAACVPSFRMMPSQWCAMSREWLKMHTRFSPRSLVVSSFYAGSTFLFVVNYLMEVCPLSCGMMSQSLSPPLQRGVRFLHRHLPTSHSVALTIDLPHLVAERGDFWAYRVPYK